MPHPSEGPKVDSRAMSTERLISLVGQTRQKVAEAASDLELLSKELRRRLSEHENEENTDE